MGRVLAIFGLLFVLLLGVLVWVVSVDHQHLRDDVESFLSETLQREFRINGPLHLRVGQRIELSADEIVLDALPENAHPELLSVQHFAVVIDTASLLSDTVIIESLVIDGVALRLEQDADGVANWDLLPAEAEDTPAPETDSDAPVPVMFRKVSLSSAKISMRSEGLAEPLLMSIASLSTSVDSNDVVQLDLDGDIGGTDFSGNASVDSWSGLLAQTAIAVSVDAALGEVQFSGDISLADLQDPSRPVADVRLSGPNVEYLTDILEIKRITSGPLDLDFSIQPEGEMMRFGLNGAIGEFKVDGEGTFDDLNDPQDLNIEFAASGGNASAMFGAFGIEGLPPEAFSISTVVQKKGGSVNVERAAANIGSTEFNATAQLGQFPSLAGAVAVVRTSGPDIAQFAALSGLPPDVHSRFSASVELQSEPIGGTNAIANVEVFDTSVVLNGRVSDDPQLVGSAADIQATATNLARLAAIAGFEGLPSSNADLKVRVERIDSGVELQGGVLQLNNDHLGFSGRIGDDLMSSDTSLELDLALENLRDTLRAFDVDTENLPPGSLKASTRVSAAANALQLADTQIEFADSTLLIDGEIGDLSGGLTADLDVELAGARLQKVFDASAAGDGDDRPYRIASKVILDSDSVALNNIVASVSGLLLRGDIALGRDRPQDHVEVSMQASSEDVFSFAKTFGDFDGPANTALNLSVDALIEKGEYRIDRFDIDIGDARIDAKGRLGAAPEFSGSRLDVSMDIPNAADLGELLGMDLPAEIIKSSFRVRNEGEALRVDDFSANVGDSVVSGQILFHNQGLPHVEVDLNARRVDLRTFSPAEDDEPAAETPGDGSGRIIPDTVIPYEMLGKFSAVVSVSIDEFIISNGSTYTDVRVAANVADGALHVTELRMTGDRGGLFSARLGVEPLATGGNVWTRLSGKGVDLGLPAATEEDRLALPRYDVSLAVVGTGATTRELAATANGYAKIVSGEGRINTGSLSMFSQDFLYELLNTINPFLKSDPNTNIKCSAVLATVEGGLLTGRPLFVLQSERVKIVADARIDLGTEKLDADFNTIAQKGLGISLGDLVNPYVRVGGTIGNPGLSFDQKSALFEGGAAVATGGISILALNFKNRFMTDKDPCGKAIEDASYQFAELETKYGNAENAAEILEAGKRK